MESNTKVASKILANLSVICLLAILILPSITLAQTGGPVVNPPESGGKICNPLSTDCSPGSSPDIPAFVNKIVDGVIKIGIPIVALALIYCGFLFVFALGNPEKLKKAKEALLWTVVGAAIFLGATLIAKLIIDTITTVAK